MGGPPVYQHGLFEHSIDPCQNSLDSTFKGISPDMDFISGFIKINQYLLFNFYGVYNFLHRSSQSLANIFCNGLQEKTYDNALILADFPVSRLCSSERVSAAANCTGNICIKNPGKLSTTAAFGNLFIRPLVAFGFFALSSFLNPFKPTGAEHQNTSGFQ